MQGVDYPVLGVSDTGDTQMMYPDQDYKFDGEKVTEYPMAQDGGWLDKYQPEPMRQDATRNVVPRKMTDKERLEAVATSDQAQKKALNTAKEVITERQKNKATKGDLNTPGSWNIKEKARLFPSSVGGAGEMFDEYVNPATYVGILGDALGESVAARDPKGIATSLGLSAIGGGLGFDPIGGGIKAVKSIGKSIGKGIVKPSFNSGKEAYDFINNMVNNGQEEQMLNILTKKTGKTSRQLENEFGRAIGNDGTIRDPEYIIRHANMLSGKNNLPKFPKSLKELDEKAGELVSPSSSSKFDNNKIVARANEILKKGVGIKNKDIPIELKSRTDNELELWVNDNNPQYVTGQSKSGTIDLRPNFRGANKSLTFTDWLKGKKPTTKYDTYDPDAIPGVIKAGDFPYQSRLDLEGTGIGAETAEALKQALNEEGLQLFSSKTHTEAGKLRYLTEFLNNRKQVVDYNDNPDWMIQAEALRDLLGGAPISKKEAKAYMNEYPVLKPAHVRFQYQDGGNINKKLKEEAEERLARMNRPKATISQYTPKPGEQAKFDKQKLERIAEDNAPLNRMAASKGARNMQDAIEAALIMEGGMFAGKLIGKGAKAAAKYATEQTALKNAYKLNPFAFKSTEGMMYRGIGKEGMEDALQSGLFRAKQDVTPTSIGNFNTTRQFSKAYYSPRFDIADQYGQGFIAEVPREASGWGKRYGTKEWSQIAQRDIPITEGKVLQKDWLKRYKEVPKPTSTSRQLTNEEIRAYNQKLFLDRKKGLGNQGPTDAPPEGLMPFESPEYKQGGWLNKYK
jgi:hypothetical protein